MEPEKRRELTVKSKYRTLWGWYRYRIQMNDRQKKWQSVPIIKRVLWEIHAYYLNMRKKYQKGKHRWKPVILPKHIRYILETNYGKEQRIKILYEVERLRSSTQSEGDASEECSLLSVESIPSTSSDLGHPWIHYE